MSQADPIREHSVPLSALFCAFAGQLQQLSDVVRDLEHVTHDAIDCNEAASPDMIISLQKFDYLQQSLDDLAALADMLGSRQSAACLTPQEQFDLMAKLQLAQTKALLLLAENDLAHLLDGEIGDTTIF